MDDRHALPKEDREPTGPDHGDRASGTSSRSAHGRANESAADAMAPAASSESAAPPGFNTSRAEGHTTDPATGEQSASVRPRRGEHGIPHGGFDGDRIHPPGPVADDVGAHRLHPAWIAIGAVRRFRGFFVPLLVLLLTRDPGQAGMLGIVLLATLAMLAWQAVEWATTRWDVANGQVRLTTGVLGRRERLVPLERVQSVDLTDTPLERVFGVAGVRIETAAGGAQGGIVLEAVGRREAEALRTDLLAARAASAPSPTATQTAGDGAAPAADATGAGTIDTAEVLVRLGWREVVLAGATSGRIGPAVALLGFGVGLLDDVAELPLAGRLAGWLPMAGERGPGTVVAAVLAGAAIAWLLAIGGAVLTWAGFELRRDGDRLFLSHGLLDRRRRTVPLQRIQAVSVRESSLRRPLGLAEIRFASAGWGAGEQDSGILVPLVREADAAALLERIAPALAPPLDPPAFRRPPARARGRYLGAPLRVLAVVVLLGIAAAGFAPGIAWWWGLALLAGLPLAILHGWLGWRDSGWALDGNRLLLQRGGLEQTLTVAPRRRLQRRGTVQTPFARRARLATFAADVASGGGGGRLRLPHLDAGEAARLVTILRD